MAKAKEFTLKPGRLWPDTPSGNPLDVEIFGSTGEFQSGKTILGASIAPGVHPASHPFAGKPRTLYLDLEKSGKTYGGTGWLRIDVPAEMVKLHGNKYTQKQMAEWFNAFPSRIKPGQYDVIVVDPANDIESGEVDIVKANPQEYGYSKAQVENSVGLLMAAMKAHWKKVLMQFSTVCQCFYFTTHLRDEFRGGKPSGKRDPRGKETLAELASLYLWLERLPNEKGEVNDKPSAIVLKQRLADTYIGDDGNLVTVALMPPRIPVATVQAIRGYIANPPDYTKLATGERVIEKVASEEDLLRLKLAVAETDRDATNARITLEGNRKSFAEVQAAKRASAPQASDQAHVAVADQAAKKAIATGGAVAEQAEIERLNAKAEAELVEADAKAKELAASAPAEHKPPEKAPKKVPEKVAEVAKEANNVPPTNTERFTAAILALGYRSDPTFKSSIEIALGLRAAKKFSDLNSENQGSFLGWLETLVRCQSLAGQLGYTEEKLGPWLKQKTGASKINGLTEEAAKALLVAFEKKAAEQAKPSP